PAGRRPRAPASSVGSSRGRNAPSRPDRSSAPGRGPAGPDPAVGDRSSPGTTGKPAACQCCAPTSRARFWHSGAPAPDRDRCAMATTSFPKAEIRVLLLEGVSPSAVEIFRAAGYTSIDIHAGSLPEDELKLRIAEAHIIGIRSRTQLTAGVLEHARR